jgi:hypothetical protein
MSIQNEEEKSVGVDEQSNWGAILFVGTLIALAVFFWWLLIYSGGAVVHHG